MFTRFVIIWILLMTLVSCTPNPTENLNQLIQNSVTPFPSKTPPREKKTATPSLTHTPTNTSTNTATPTPTLTPSPNPSVTPGMIKPELVTICPPIPEVPIDEMDLSGHLVVQMYGGNEGEIPLSESGLVIVSFEDLIPRPVQDSAERNGVGLFRVYQSQNNEFITLTYRNQATTKTQVWHSTWDGSIQTKVFEDVFEQNDDLWQFAGLGTKYLVFRRDWTEFPLFVIDYVAGEKLKIPEFEEGIYIRAPFIVNDIPYLVGLRGDDLINEIQLYNLADFSSLPVLQWLKEEMNYLFSKVEFSGGKLFVVVPQKNSVDFGINLDLETIQSSLDYGDVMKSYVLPGENGEADRWMMIEGVPINNQSSYLFWDASQTNSHIYRLDFGAHILYQYCYTQKSGSEEWSYKALSFDEKYIAFTHTTGILDETVTSVEILDLETGQFAIIPDANYRVIGWGLAVP